ncbi:MAG: hypothetical protein ACSNEK_05345 [Parachlamydiaceae bacterium]
MNFFFPDFLSKWLGLLIGVILLQQTLVALGTFFLGKMSNDFPTLGFQVSIAFALFLSIFLPGTIVSYLVELFFTRALKFSQQSYLSEYSKNSFNHPTHFRSESTREKKHDIMCRSGQDAINKALYFFSDVLATSLNVIFNSLSIILITDVWFGIILFVAGLLGTLIVYLSKEKISHSSRMEMVAETQLNEHLSKSWDNIILGNSLFFDRWLTQFHDLFKKAENASIKATEKRNWPVALAGMLTNGIVLGFALITVWLDQNNLGNAMAILVTLPRSLQVVMHIQVCQSYLAQWKHLKEKLNITEESLQEPSPIDLSSLITESKIKANNSPVTIENFLPSIEKLNKGRITISGENGSGKSTLMLLIKQKFGSLAAYLPAHHHLILKEPRFKLSSGEVTLKVLEDIKNEDCKVFLLDEWDANLSSENKAIIDQLLNNLSLQKIIIEVRHH